jgi:hypothetical protein
MSGTPHTHIILYPRTPPKSLCRRTFGVSAVSSIPLGLPTPGATNGLLPLNSTHFAFAHMPAFAANGAQNAALGNLLAKSLQQLFGALAGSTHYLYQPVSPPHVITSLRILVHRTSARRYLSLRCFLCLDGPPEGHNQASGNRLNVQAGPQRKFASQHFLGLPLKSLVL